jgi:hypothetical protein
LEHLEQLAETGIRDLHDIVTRAYGGLGDKLTHTKTPVVITPIWAVRNLDVAPPPDYAGRPPDEEGPFGIGWKEFEWRLEFRGRYLLRFVASVGWRPYVTAVVARCEIFGPKDQSLLALHLVRQENRVDWFTASGDLKPVKSVGQEELQQVLTRAVETELFVFGTAVR